MSQSQPVPGEIQVYETSAGGRIYQIPVQAFPILWGYVYFVIAEDAAQEYQVLIDTGSGYGDSNEHLELGFDAVSKDLGKPVDLGCLTHVLVTHGHIDHFGGLTYVRPRTSAKVGVHELDLRNLTHHEERLMVVSRRLNGFLVEAGLSAERRKALIELYKLTKSIYQSVRIDFTYETVAMQVGPFELLHVPGHCPGHVAIRLHDVLFSGDHVLNQTSPHQAPEHLTPSTGLDHYLKSLDLVEGWAGDVRLTLGGHEEPIYDLAARIAAIKALHEQRIGQVLDYLHELHTIDEISRKLFGEVHGYNVLLALEETGAHVEYLYQYGLLDIANLSDLDEANGAIPILYRKADRELRVKHAYER